MDIRFQNQCSLTREIFLEFSKSAYRYTSRGYRRGALILGSVFVLGAVASFVTEGIGYASVFFMLGAGCTVFTYFKGYVMLAEKSLNSYQLKYGSDAVMTTTFYEDSLSSSITNASNTLKYSHITKLIETPALIILMAGRNGIILKRDGFGTESAENFLAFIREKIS